MKISLFVVGKTQFSFVDEACQLYFNRLKHYVQFDFTVIEDVKKAKNLTPDQLKSLEGDKILAKIQANEFVVLLDEKGKDMTSVNFAKWIEQHQIRSTTRMVFVVGGAYGFSPEIYQRANAKLRLSSMTFSHQIIRLIFAEQIYRAFTIIKGEPYHNV